MNNTPKIVNYMTVLLSIKSNSGTTFLFQKSKKNPCYFGGYFVP